MSGGVKCDLQVLYSQLTVQTMCEINIIQIELSNIIHCATTQRSFWDPQNLILKWNLWKY